MGALLKRAEASKGRICDAGGKKLGKGWRRGINDEARNETGTKQSIPRSDGTVSRLLSRYKSNFAYEY